VRVDELEEKMKYAGDKMMGDGVIGPVIRKYGALDEVEGDQDTIFLSGLFTIEDLKLIIKETKKGE